MPALSPQQQIVRDLIKHDLDRTARSIGFTNRFLKQQVVNEMSKFIDDHRDELRVYLGDDDG